MKKFIDMTRPTTFYAMCIGMLMILSLVLSNIPMTNLSAYVFIPYRRELAAGLFVGGTLFGLLAMLRHLQRIKMPWKVPQSQVFICFAIFFSLTLAALVIAR